MTRFRIAGALLLACWLPLIYFTWFGSPENRGLLRTATVALAFVCLWMSDAYFNARNSS